MWELDCEESWVLKNWCFWTVLLEKTLECLLDCKEIKPVHPQGNQSWISTGRLMLKLKLQYFGHLMQRTDFTGKDPDAGQYWRQEEKGTTEDEMVGWHHWLNGYEFEQSPGDVKDREAWCAIVTMGSQRIRHDWATEQQNVFKTCA